MSKGKQTRDQAAASGAGMAWSATIISLILLVLLIAFIVQNQEDLTIPLFGLRTTIASGLALLIAATGGGLLVAAAGTARILQLKSRRRQRNAGLFWATTVSSGKEVYLFSLRK